jgi:hypothetical protein
VFPDPRCPEELGTDPDFPWSVKGEHWPGGTQCGYAYWGEMAEEAAQDTKSFFVDANYRITDRVDFFASGLFTHGENSTQLAPERFDYTVTMSPSVPQNPTNPDHPTNYRGDPFGGQSVDIDTDGDKIPDTTVEGPFDLWILYRNVPAGNRKREGTGTVIDYVAGLRGRTDWLRGAEWELAAQWSEATGDWENSGQINVPLMQSEIDAGTFDV